MNRMLKQAMVCAVMLGIVVAAPLQADETHANPGIPPLPGGASSASAPSAPHAMETPAQLKMRLELTDDQASKLDAAMTAHRSTVRTLIDQRRAAVQKLRQQLDAKAKDEDIQSTLDSLNQIEKSMQSESESFRKTLTGILTPTQRGKLLVGMLGRMRQHMMHGGQGGEQGEAGQ